MIIVDNLVDNFKLQQNNGLPIKTWTDDISDKELIHFGNFLKFLYEKKPNDVRPIVKNAKDEIYKRTRKNITYPYVGLEYVKFFNEN